LTEIYLLEKEGGDSRGSPRERITNGKRDCAPRVLRMNINHLVFVKRRGPRRRGQS